MSRLRPIDESDADPSIRRYFEWDRRRVGAVMKTTEIYGRRPTILAGLRELAAGIARSGLIEPGLQALVCVRVASVNRCPF